MFLEVYGYKKNKKKVDILIPCFSGYDNDNTNNPVSAGAIGVIVGGVVITVITVIAVIVWCKF